MKKLSIILAVIWLTVNANAQAPNQMTYQAVVRDASNNLVANTVVGVQISILKGSESGNEVYSETQQPTTNTNGLISIVIGTPPNSDLGPGLAEIDWGNDIYFIKTEIDPTGGSTYTVTGTTLLMSVPYALHAKTAENVSGLEKITENGNTGWRLKGQNPEMFGNIGDDAMDLSKSYSPSAIHGATGGNSTAMGMHTVAKGFHSTAMGIESTASGDFSTAIGSGTIASGDFSTVMGKNTTAESYGQISLGIYSVSVPGNATSYVPTDRLFVIGNGADSSNKSDAMVVLKDGTVTAPSLTNDLINKAGNKALITKEYVDILKSKTYAIGDVALGGVVFWVDETGQHGLVCSLENLSNGIVWMDHNNSNSFNINFISGNGIGAGKLNTSLILSSLDVQKLSNTNFAALLCAMYSKSDINNYNNTYLDGGGTINISYGDWYLPSVYELSMIYPNKELISTVCQDNGGEGFSDKSYWSSNQYSETEAWVYFMSDNAPSPDAKNYNAMVRAVRSF